jgi:hypothetical protein
MLSSVRSVHRHPADQPARFRPLQARHPSIAWGRYLDAADDRIGKVRKRGRKGFLAALRDAVPQG